MSSPNKIVVVIDAPGYHGGFATIARNVFDRWKTSHPVDQHGRRSLGERATEVFFESIISGKSHYAGAEGDSLAFAFDANYGGLYTEGDRDNLLYVIGNLLRCRADSEGCRRDHWSATVFCHGDSENAIGWTINAGSNYEPRELGRQSFSFERAY